VTDHRFKIESGIKQNDHKHLGKKEVLKPFQPKELKNFSFGKKREKARIQLCAKLTTGLYYLKRLKKLFTITGLFWL